MLSASEFILPAHPFRVPQSGTRTEFRSSYFKNKPPEIMQKIIPIILIFLGEGLAIYSEIVAAKNINTFAATFWKMSGVMTLAGLLLIAGYMFGLKYLNNIWIVGVVSIGGIIIMEPVITYLLFQEFPSRGALIGLVLGILGLLSALFIK